jgi:hypothetical protein
MTTRQLILYAVCAALVIIGLSIAAMSANTHKPCSAAVVLALVTEGDQP